MIEGNHYTVVFKTLNRRADSGGTMVDFLANYTKNTYISPSHFYSYKKINFKVYNIFLFKIFNRDYLLYVIIKVYKKKSIFSTFKIDISLLLPTIYKRITF